MIVNLISYGQNVTQKEDLPQYYIVNNDTIGVIITIEQCQVLDHNTELLDLYKKASLDFDHMENGYIVVINKQNEKIAILELDIKNLKKQSILQRDIINNLENQVKEYKKKDELSKEESKNNQIIIDGLKSDLKKQKMKTAMGFGGTVLGIIGVVLLVIVK